MNKIFKHKRGASGLKVVCEFAKSHCSSGEKTAVNSGAHVSTRSGFKSLSIALISALTLGVATPAMAVNGEYSYLPGSQAKGTNALAIGVNAKAKDYEKNTAYGSDAEASGGGWNLAIGSNAHAIANGYLNRGNAIAIGSDAQATGQRAMAIGANAEATQGQGVAIGSGTKSIGAQSTAIGNDVVATGMSAIAIGNDDIWNGGATDSNNKLLGYERQVFTDEELKDPKIVEALDAMCRKEDCPNSFGLRKVGNHYEKTGVNFMHWSPTLSAGLGSIVIGSRSVAVGKGSTAIGTLTVATGDESTAIGTLSKATASKAIAIGRDSIANMENSVALGVSSKTDYAGIKTKAYVPSLGYVMPMANSVGVISVGSSNQQRRIVNLAPGALDTDAVNVSQLKSLAESLGMDGINDSADKMMRYLSVEKATGEAATLQASLAKEKAFKTYAELRKIRDMMALNEKVMGGTYDPIEKKKITDQITALEHNNGDFKANITTVNLGSITANSSEDDIKEVTNAINAYTNNNPFALTQIQKDALKKANATNEGATGADAIAIGYSAKSTGAQAVSLGKTATASGADAIAIGNGATAVGEKSIVIGKGTKANSYSTINIGEGVVANLGDNTNLIGFGNKIGNKKADTKVNNTTILGNKNEIDGKEIKFSTIIGTFNYLGDKNKESEFGQNVVIGDHIQVNNSQEATTIGNNISALNSKGGIAIGGDDAGIGKYQTVTIQGKGAMAIGSGSQATADTAMSLGVFSNTTVADGVALGSNSTADRVSIANNKTTAYNGSDTNVANTIKGNYGAVAVGNSNATRQITNVAAGSNDTDAVNVAQLKSVGFNVKGNNTTNLIKSGKIVEFASGKEYLKINHTTTTDGNSKFTFDIDQETLKTKIGATSGGNYSLDFSGDIGNKITRDQSNQGLKIQGGVTTTDDLSTGNIGVEANGDTLNIKLAKALTGLTSAEFTNAAGDTTTITGDKITINPNGNTEDNKTVSLGKDGINAGSKIISNVADGTGEKDAVNKKQAETIADNAVKKLTDSITDGTNVYFNAESDDAATGSKKVANTKDIKFEGDGNVKTSIKQTADKSKTIVKFALNTKDLNLGGKDGTNGTDGKIAVNGADGKSGVEINGKDGTIGAKGADGKDGVTINGKDGTIGLAGTNGANGLTIRGGKGADGVDGANGADGITRIIYKDANNKDHEVATLDDGIKFVGNKGDKALKLNKQFTIQGSDDNKYTAGSTDKWDTFDAGANIMTKAEADGDNGKLTIALAKALKGLTSAEFAGGTAGGKTVINGDGVSYNKADNLESDGTVKDPKQTVSLGKDGINAGSKIISNVADGTGEKDAVNMKQMNETIKKEIATNNTNTALTFVGDVDNTKAKDGKISIVGGQTDTKKLSDNKNIGVVAKDGKLDIKLAKDIEVDSVTAKNKITVGEGANKITIADGKITGITSAVDPNGELADKLKAIDNVAGKTAAEKAAEKKAAIQAALKNVDNGSVATVGDLKNVTNGLDSVVENVTNITKNVTSITNNVNNITNITNMVANSDDKKTIDKAAEVSKKYQSVTNDKDKQKIAEEAKEVVKANKIKTYNPYEKTVKNNTTIVEAIQNMNERGIKFIHVSEKDNLGEDDNFAFDSKDSRANKIGSIGIGMNAASTAENAIATGTKSEASGADSIATGTDSKASGTNAIAMGTGAQAIGKNTISIGKGNKVIGENSGAIGDPTTMENVNGVYSMGNYNSIQGGGEKAKADKTARDIFAIGNNIGSDKKVTDKANGSVILGSNGYSNVTNGVALGYGSNASVEKGKVGYDITGTNHDKDTSGIWKSTESAVSVGNIDKKITRQITSVAAGTQDTDAVNVAQLKAVANQITAVTTNNGVTTSDQTFNPKTGRQVSYNPTYAPKVTNTGVNSVAIGANSVANRANTVSVGSAGNERIIANVADGVAPTDAANMRQLQSVANMVGEVKKDAMAGTASAMAIGNLPQATIPGKGMMAIGAGYYKGQTATALGVSKMSENGRWVFKASASYDSQRNVGAAGAVGFHF